MQALVHSAHVQDTFHSGYVNQSVSLCPSGSQPVSQQVCMSVCMSICLAVKFKELTQNDG